MGRSLSSASATWNCASKMRMVKPKILRRIREAATTGVVGCEQGLHSLIKYNKHKIKVCKSSFSSKSSTTSSSALNGDGSVRMVTVCYVRGIVARRALFLAIQKRIPMTMMIIRRNHFVRRPSPLGKLCAVSLDL